VTPDVGLNYNWLYCPLSREAAEDMLMSRGVVGSFLMRESESTSGDFSLSVRNEDKIRHFKITQAEGGLVVMGLEASG
jgi:hypothetical protein